MFGLTNGKWMTCQATANQCWHRSMGRPFPGGDSSWLQPTFVLMTERRVEKATRVPVSLNLGAPKLCVIFKGLTGPLRGRSKCPVLLQAIGHKSLNLSHSKPALCLSVYAPISWLSPIPGQKGKGIVSAVLVWKDSGVTSLAQSNVFLNIFLNAFPWPWLLECFWLLFCDMAFTEGCSGWGAVDGCGAAGLSGPTRLLCNAWI